MNFEQAIRAQFATQHLMAERGLTGPLEIFTHLGYDLFLQNPKKYKAIQELYKKEGNYPLTTSNSSC